MNNIKYKLKNSEEIKTINLSDEKDDMFNSFIDDLITIGIESIVECKDDLTWLKDKLDEIISKTNDINSQYLELGEILKKDEKIQ